MASMLELNEKLDKIIEILTKKDKLKDKKKKEQDYTKEFEDSEPLQ